ncbi:MAG TPA: sigma factor-like helix-turn-helix DNA-binding protein [Acidiferrobacter sp.]|nr:sigma factor-like helix-turn-helix DNA-binding protein [Acidiferrobacter sp.]
MEITLDDIENMTSPGWEGFEEVLEDGDDYEENENCEGEIVKEKEEEEEKEEKATKIRYEGGRRAGMATGDLCDHLRNCHLSMYDRLAQEFSAIKKTYPKAGADLKILMRLASGMPYKEIAARLGRSHKTVKNAAARLREFRDFGILKLLPDDQVETGVALMIPLPRSRAGRKARGWMSASVVVDLFGHPLQSHKPRRPRKEAPPRVKARAVYEGQMEFAWAA